MSKRRTKRSRKAKGLGAMKLVGLSVPALVVGAVVGVVLVKKGVV